MGFIDNKYVAKFIAGGAAPPLPPSHEPTSTPSQPSPSSHAQPQTLTTQLPPGWMQQYDSSTQKVYFLDQTTGRTQWVPPASVPLDSASTLSGETVLPPRGNDIVRRNHVYLNLPTAKEREEIMRKAAEKREREGPPKPVSLGRKILRYPGQAVEFGMRGGGFVI